MTGSRYALKNQRYRGGDATNGVAREGRGLLGSRLALMVARPPGAALHREEINDETAGARSKQSSSRQQFKWGIFGGTIRNLLFPPYSKRYVGTKQS